MSLGAFQSALLNNCDYFQTHYESPLTCWPKSCQIANCQVSTLYGAKPQIKLEISNANTRSGMQFSSLIASFYSPLKFIVLHPEKIAAVLDCQTVSKGEAKSGHK